MDVTASSRPASVLPALALALKLSVFTQAIFAGLLLSGFVWARDLHRGNAWLVLLLAVNLISWSGSRPDVRRQAIVIALLIAVQAWLGMMVGDGVRALWLHIPLGVGLIGLVERTEHTIAAGGHVRD